MDEENDRYITISRSAEAVFKDRGSRFLAFAYPVDDETDVKERLDHLRHAHPSANHVCYAYIIGADKMRYRANDDGEPNGSAGLPILNQLRSADLTNVLVAVVRYFGGTKLGVSGLIGAYKQAASSALQEARIVTRQPMQQLIIRFPHPATGAVERMVRQYDMKITNMAFEETCTWTLQLPKSLAQQVLQEVEGIPQTKICDP